MNLDKLRVFAELQDKVMNDSKGMVPLVTFYDERDGVSVHNPFMDTTGRFEVNPIKEYGEENIARMEKAVKKIENEMECLVDYMEAFHLRNYLAADFFAGKEPRIERFQEIVFEDEPMFCKSDEMSPIQDTLNFYVPLYGLWEELAPKAAKEFVTPVDDDKQVNLYIDYNFVDEEVFLSWTCGGESGSYEVSEKAKEILLAKMDEHVKEYGEESLKKMVDKALYEEIWDALEKAVQEAWYAQPDENGHYDIVISADYRETNEGLLETAYDNRESAELKNSITEVIYDGYEEAIWGYESELLEKAGFDTGHPLHEKAKEVMWERISFSPDYDHFMKDDMRMNLLLATDWEQNVEFTDIKDNMARWIDSEAFEEMKEDSERYGTEMKEPDNALLWLVKQQGYSMEDLKKVNKAYKAFLYDDSNGVSKGLKAVNIEWDVDCEEDRALLPTEIGLPEWIEKDDYDGIDNYLSDVTGYCHKGYEVIVPEDKEMSYDEKIESLSKEHGKFLVSVCEAIDNQTYSMGCVTILVKSSLEEYCELFERDEEGKNLVPKEIVILKDAYVTLHNPWDGAGCMGWIELEKDMVVPNEMIFDSEIEGVKRDYGWTVDSISGLVHSCWKESKGVQDVQKEIEKPGLDEMIHGAAGRTSVKGNEENQKGPGVGLNR